MRQAEMDLDMVADVAKVRLDRAQVQGHHFDNSGTDAAFARAFQRYGLPVLARPPAEVARRLARAAIKEQLLVALDDWATLNKLAKSARRDQLLAVSRLADGDAWRQQLRGLLRRPDPVALTRLSQRREELLSQSPSTIMLFVALCINAGEQSTNEAVLRQAQARHPDDFWLNLRLAIHLQDAKPPRPQEAEGFFRTALAVQPDNPGAHFNLGSVLMKQGKDAAAEGCFRRAVALKPDYAAAWYVLGGLLANHDRLEEALDCLGRSLKLDDSLFGAHTNLAAVLQKQDKLPEALRSVDRALALNDHYSRAHYLKGMILGQQCHNDLAIPCFRRAIALDSDYGPAHSALGMALLNVHDAAAEASFRQAIRLALDLFEAHYYLARALFLQGKEAEAEDRYRQALKVEPGSAKAHSNLSWLLYRRGKTQEAMACYRRAIQLDPNLSKAHFNLGRALNNQGKLAEAADCYGRAIQIKPDYAEAHCNLGLVLRDQGRFAEAIQQLQRGHELGSRDPAWHYASARWLREAQALAKADARLPAVLKGQAQPADTGERLRMAQLCLQYRRLYATAADFYLRALTDSAKTAEKVTPGIRYDAACAAARAGTRQGDDAATLDDGRRARWRQQALDWLRVNLALHATTLKSASAKDRQAVYASLHKWQRAADLAGVRDDANLAKLPEAERKLWRQLWTDVAAVLARAK